MGGYNASFPQYGGGGGGGGSNIFSNPYMQGLIPFLAGGAGALGSSGTVTTNGTSSMTGSSSGTSSGTTTPVLSPEQQAIAKLFTQGAQNQYNQGTDLTPYKFSGMQQINQQGNNNAAQIANSLASRGLSYSPAAGTAETQNILNTGNQQNQFLSSIPLLQRQINQGNLQQLISSFSALPTGSTFSGSQNQQQQQNQTMNQTQKTQQSPWAGLLSGLGAGIGLLAKH